MIDLGSIRGLLDHDHEVHCYCSGCDRWHALNLHWLVRIGQGDRRLPIKVRCRRCGQRGIIQIRPPMPPRGSVGWIMPPVHGRT
jgi:hypothetical protein